MYPNNTFYSTPYQSGASIKVLLVIAVLALLLGLVLANTEILNPKRTQLELEEKKERTTIELERQREQALIDLERQRRQMEEDLAFRHAMHQVILDLTVVIGVLFGFGLMVGTALGIVLITRSLISRTPPPPFLPIQPNDVPVPLSQDALYSRSSLSPVETVH